MASKQEAAAPLPSPMRATRADIEAMPIAGDLENRIENDSFFKAFKAGKTDQEAVFYEQILHQKMPSLVEFVPEYRGLVEKYGRNYLSLRNVTYSGPRGSPSLLDITVRTPNPRNDYDLHTAARFLGCYVHGCISKGRIFRNGVNNYKGQEKTVDHFSATVVHFLKKMGPQPNLIQRLSRLIDVLAQLKGYIFRGSSLLFTHDEDGSASLHFIDFEKLETITDIDKSDEKLLCGLRYILIMLRNEWVGPVSTVYFATNGERLDSTDPDWVRSSLRPSDSPLSELGVRQASDLAERLRHINLHRCVVSPFLRAIRTAEPLARLHRCQVAVELGLSENSLSPNGTCLYSEIQSVSAWVDDQYTSYWGSFPSHAANTANRVGDTMAHLIDEARGKGDLVIVSHRSVLQSCLDSLFPGLCRNLEVEYGSLTMIYEQLDGTWATNLWNDGSYLTERSRYGLSNREDLPLIRKSSKDSPCVVIV